MKESFKLIYVLTLVCLISAFLIAGANLITKGPIEKANALQVERAIADVLPEGAAHIEKTSISMKNAAGEAYEQSYWKTDKGYAMELSTQTGYSGEIKMMVGFTRDAQFWTYKVLSHAETPGLGAHITGSFIAHVKDRPAHETSWRTTKDGGDIVPITAATISSRAVCSVIAEGTEILKAIQAEEGAR